MTYFGSLNVKGRTISTLVIFPSTSPGFQVINLVTLSASTANNLSPFKILTDWRKHEVLSNPSKNDHGEKFIIFKKKRLNI